MSSEAGREEEELEFKFYLQISTLACWEKGKSMLIIAREEEQPTRFKLPVRAGQSMAIRAEKLGWGSRTD